MSQKIRYCLLCQQYDGRTTRSRYTRICTVEREEKLREGYRRRYNGQEIDQPLLNQLVHQKCYNKTIEYTSSVDESIPVDDLLGSIESHHEEEEDDQNLVVQSRSRAILPKNVKSLLERSQRVCVVCHSYKYSHTNRMKQVVSNIMANKLAEGFLHRYKRPYGKSLLDAYIHDLCYRKLYGSYRSQPSRRVDNRSRFQYQQQMINQSVVSPHKTRSRSNLNQSETSIDELFSTPFSISTATINPNIELSARSCLFRPCLQRLTPEETEFYTKRNIISKEIEKENHLISTVTTNDSVVDLNPSTDVHTDEEDLPPPCSILNKLSKISKTAEIRYRSSNSSNPLTIDHNYMPNIPSQKVPDDLEELYPWLIERLNSSEYPLSMSEVLAKYREVNGEEPLITGRISLHRVRLRHRLEKYYPTEFIFTIPNKRDGTYIALNNIDYYIRVGIKKAQEEKEKAAESSILSSIVIPPAPKDYKRETCEEIMDGIRKIRLYIRDPKQIDCSPSLLMQNLIGLITTSEKQFDRISHNYDFYRMIDENLFEPGPEKGTIKLDKTIRNMSLASDIISARHDHQISQKHYLLADEIAAENFNCTPRHVITLLNRYGHACSYKSYRKMKNLIERTANELGEKILIDVENSSILELDLMEL